MLIEALSLGKDPVRQDANEDRFVVLPGRAYAVIDGITDRLGTFYGGRSSGRIAAECIAVELERTLAADAGADLDAPALLSRLTDAIGNACDRFGMRERVRVQPNLRFGATLALFRHRDGFDEVVLVGDSGVRLNGAQVMQVDKTVDAITAALRAAAWHALTAVGADHEARHRVSRCVVFHGAAQGSAALEGLIDDAGLAAIAARAVAESVARFPDLPEEAIASLVAGGIVNGQFQHQNDAASPLGYSAVDGFPIPMRHVTVVRLPIGEARTIELFSDGYFEPGAAFGVASWEAAADEVERVDPDKIGRYASVKGSVGGVRADDRTYVGIR